MPGLREKQKLERRRQILVAARTMVIDGGLDSLTMRGLAEASHLSVPTIYNLVGDRSDLLEALLGAGGDQFELVNDAAPDDPVERALAAVNALVTVIGDNRDIVAAVLSTDVALELGRSDDGVLGRFATTIGEALEQARAQRILGGAVDGPILRQRMQAMAAVAIISWAKDHGDEQHLLDDLSHAVLVLFVAHAEPERHLALRRALDRYTRRLRAYDDQEPGPPTR